MALIDSELGKALEPAVKRKANRTQNLRLTAARLAHGTPEVMVKITGFGKGGNHVKAHLDYISRKGDVELENERGELYYRACLNSVCRYAEDHYIAMMYLEGMGWDPKADHQ